MHRSADFPRLNARMNCSNCGKKSKCKGCVSKCFPVPLTKEQVKRILESFDSNGDGRLSKQELKDAFYYIGSQFPRWRVAQALHRADGDHDGYISQGEMYGLVEYVWQCGYTIS
ncbi:probable calcium-binding protein CML15 [Hibiscus syriacus]|uniref:probable calcium-binding protein CML15 n=1 Tax=Hibiscus syriacus TaxID=106335 RepID=UPI001923599B|nr:probable calcium-binding protein CML15 [Hibiscus syriacus]